MEKILSRQDLGCIFASLPRLRVLDLSIIHYQSQNSVFGFPKASLETLRLSLGCINFYEFWSHLQAATWATLRSIVLYDHSPSAQQSVLSVRKDYTTVRAHLGPSWLELDLDGGETGGEAVILTLRTHSYDSMFQWDLENVALHSPLVCDLDDLAHLVIHEYLWPSCDRDHEDDQLLASLPSLVDLEILLAVAHDDFDSLDDVPIFTSVSQSYVQMPQLANVAFVYQPLADRRCVAREFDFRCSCGSPLPVAVRDIAETVNHLLRHLGAGGRFERVLLKGLDPVDEDLGVQLSALSAHADEVIFESLLWRDEANSLDVDYAWPEDPRARFDPSDERVSQRPPLLPAKFDTTSPFKSWM